MRCEIVTTREGTRAVRDRDSGEVMHPVGGPLVETERLYVTPSRLAARLAKGPVTLFDVGLGAGSNAGAAFRVAARVGGTLDIVSFDRSLAAFALALDHATDFGLDGVVAEAALSIARTGRYEDAKIRWRYVEGELPETLEGQADVVFWDPFSPRANPALWGYVAFDRLRTHCKPSCTVHTYSGATSVRAALLLAGFEVGFGPQISPGKRATTAAVDRHDLAEPLDARWFERLARSSAPLPADAGDRLPPVKLP